MNFTILLYPILFPIVLTLINKFCFEKGVKFCSLNYLLHIELYQDQNLLFVLTVVLYPKL